MKIKILKYSINESFAFNNTFNLIPLLPVSVILFRESRFSRENELATRTHIVVILQWTAEIEARDVGEQQCAAFSSSGTEERLNRRHVYGLDNVHQRLEEKTVLTKRDPESTCPSCVCFATFSNRIDTWKLITTMMKMKRLKFKYSFFLSENHEF